MNEQFLIQQRDNALEFLRRLRAEWDAKKNIHRDADPVRTWIQESYGARSPVEEFLDLGDDILGDMRGFDEELARLESSALDVDHTFNTGYDGPHELESYRVWLWGQRENLDYAIIRWHEDMAMFSRVYHKWSRDTDSADIPIDVYGLMEPDSQGNIECPVCGVHLAITEDPQSSQEIE